MSNVIYNTYRPKKLENIIGQEYIIKVLKSMLRRKKLFPVILLTGPKGTGKTTIARIITKYINCERYLKNPENDNIPCNNCESCLSIDADMSLDVQEIDAATYTGVDNIRSVLEGVYHEPSLLNRKVIIIDEVHMLSKGAFNSMLKTLEEPPAHVVFFLITTEENKIPDTILSRAMILRTLSLTKSNILEQLKKVSNLPIEILSLIASNNDSMRNALVQLEFINNLENNSLEEVIKALRSCSDKEVISIYYDIVLGNLKDACDKWKIIENTTDETNFLKKLLELIGNICKMIMKVKKLPEEYEYFYGLSMNLLLRHWEIVAYQLVNKTKNPDPLVELTFIMLTTVVAEDIDYQISNPEISPRSWT